VERRIKVIQHGCCRGMGQDCRLWHPLYPTLLLFLLPIALKVLFIEGCTNHQFEQGTLSTEGEWVFLIS